MCKCGNYGKDENSDVRSGDAGEMPQYIGTKIIYARPFDENDFNALKCNEMVENSRKGYLVRYADGYESWSPADVFEKAYRPCDAMNFGLAIEAMKMGKKVARRGWNGKGIFIEIQNPDKNSKMTSSYIFIDTTGLQTDNPDAPKSRVPWLASQTDMLSDDWVIVE